MVQHVSSKLPMARDVAAAVLIYWKARAQVYREISL